MQQLVPKLVRLIPTTSHRLDDGTIGLVVPADLGQTPLPDHDQHLAKTRQDSLESLILMMMALQQLVLRLPHQTVRVPATQALWVHPLEESRRTPGSDAAFAH